MPNWVKYIKYTIMLIVGSLAVSLILIIIVPEIPEILTHKGAKLSKVRENMRTCIIAAFTYAQMHSGKFPKSAKDSEFKSYLREHPLENPYTDRTEDPVDGTVTDPIKAICSPPVKIGKGVIEYSAVYDKAGNVTNCTIRGGDENGFTIQSLSHPGNFVLYMHNDQVPCPLD